MWIVKRFCDGQTYYLLTDRMNNRWKSMTSYRGAKAHLKTEEKENISVKKSKAAPIWYWMHLSQRPVISIWLISLATPKNRSYCSPPKIIGNILSPGFSD